LVSIASACGIAKCSPIENGFACRCSRLRASRLRPFLELIGLAPVAAIARLDAG